MTNMFLMYINPGFSVLHCFLVCVSRIKIDYRDMYVSLLQNFFEPDGHLNDGSLRPYSQYFRVFIRIENAESRNSNGIVDGFMWMYCIQQRRYSSHRDGAQKS